MQLERERERTQLSPRVCVCVFVGPITMGLWCEFLSIVGVCVLLYTVLYVYSVVSTMCVCERTF